MATGNTIQMADLPDDLVEKRARPATTGGEEPAQESKQSDWTDLLKRWTREHLDAGEEDILSQAQPMFERTLLECALDKTGGRKIEAARLLGWGRNTLTRKLKELY